MLRIALLAAAMLVTAIVSGLIAMGVAIHRQEVSVPNLQGKTVAEARRVAGDSGLQLVMERQFYSSSVPAGRVVSQSPPAASRVRRSWQIRAAESLGPQRIEIPNVVGQSERAAEFNLRRRGLELGTLAHIEYRDSPQEGVIAQAPLASANGISSPKVDLLIGAAEGPQRFVMPSFVGQPLGSVTMTLNDAGFHLNRVTPAEGAPVPSPASIVISQSPATGESVTSRSPVDLEVK